MTLTKSLNDLSVSEINDAIAKLIVRESEERKTGTPERANAFKKSIDNFNAELERRQVPEKKNSEPTPTAETGNAAGQQLQPIDIANINSGVSLVVNIEAVEEDAYFFTSEEAAKEFQYYNRSRLRSKLFAWEYGKRKKNKHTKDETLAMCAFFIAQINGIIDCYAKPEYAEILRKRVYSLGKKDDAKTYCFDIKKLKKDFDF